MTSPRQNPPAPGFITVDVAGEAAPADLAGRPATRFASWSRPGPGAGREVRAPLWVCVLVAVIGSLVVGLAVHYWDASQVRRIQGQTVSVLLNVPAGSSFNGSGDGRTISLKGDVQVVNTGPRAIQVGGVSSSSPGVKVAENAGQLVVPAGGARALNLDLTVTCGQQSGTEPLRLLLDVQTLTGQRRAYVAALNIAGTQWAEAFTTSCPTP
jgi:hypothetical protein